MEHQQSSVIKNEENKDGDKKQSDNKQQPQKSEKEKYMEEITDLFNLAYIPLDVIEDKRTFIEIKDDKYESPKNEDHTDINQFVRGIIYGSQVVLRKVFEGYNPSRIRVIQNLMNIEELEDDCSVSMIHGICFNQSTKTETKIEDGSSVFIVREWVKGNSFWKFRED